MTYEISCRFFTKHTTTILGIKLDYLFVWQSAKGYAQTSLASDANSTVPQEILATELKHMNTLF